MYPLCMPRLFWVRTCNTVCGVREGLDLCELENAPETQKCPKAFVHDCLKKRWEEKEGSFEGISNL